MLKKEIKLMLYALKPIGCGLWKARGKPVEKKLFIFMAAVFFLTAVSPFTVRAEEPTLISAVTFSHDPQGLSEIHYLKALDALKRGDCSRMRRELSRASNLGYALNPSLTEDWGYRCSAPLLDWSKERMEVSALVVSGSGRVAAAASIDGRVFILDLASPDRATIWTPGIEDISTLDVSSDDLKVAAGGGRRVVVRNVRDGRYVWAGDLRSYVSRVRFSPDGKRLAIGMNRLINLPGESLRLAGEIRCMSLSDTSSLVGMGAVPGNPAELAFTKDGKELVGFCWSESYALNTFCWLAVWNPETGRRTDIKPLRSTSQFPAHLSGDARVLVYSGLREEALSSHQRELSREGRPRDLSDMGSLAWLRDPANYRATARDVFNDYEMPIVSGRSILALDGPARRVVVRSGSGKIKVEEIGSGLVYGVSIEGEDVSKRVFASFGPGNSLVLGSDNIDLARYGWLPSEIHLQVSSRK
jgi:hypothetical protein